MYYIFTKITYDSVAITVVSVLRFSFFHKFKKRIDLLFGVIGFGIQTLMIHLLD